MKKKEKVFLKQIIHIKINMSKTRSIAIDVFNNISVREKVITFSVLAVFVIYLPTLVHSQMVTGTVVNMSLILATFLIGPYVAVLLGLMPSSFALLSGLLPLPLALIVPFIMISNAILVFTYHHLGKRRFFLSIFMAGFLKFVLLSASTYVFLTVFLKNEQLAAVASNMFGWTQMLTAVTGGVLAYTVLLAMKKV